MSCLTENIHPKMQTLVTQLTEKETMLAAMVLLAWQIGLLFARTILEEALNMRGQAATEVGTCPNCGKRLESKGLIPRQLITLVGEINWRRRVWRCANKCKIKQIVPLDDELGLEANQRTGIHVKRLACMLTIFVPFEIAAILLKALMGIAISPNSIWNWVQQSGALAQIRLEKAIEAFVADEASVEANLPVLWEKLVLAVGADGVMVPFRPNGGSPEGAARWREVKVGIVAWLKETTTASGKRVMRPVQRQVVAVLGDIDDLQPRLWMAAVGQGILEAEKVVWLCDGGRGFWRLFTDQFEAHAQGVLDYYHAAQNIWKGIRPFLDGRTSRARTWFSIMRRRLLNGQAHIVLSDLEAALQLSGLPPAAHKSLTNLYNYLDKHADHIDYAHFAQLGLPIGSGMVESTCKWLIQQRFKGVGMRWSEDGFNHLLHLRLAWVNDSFD
ncbi:MAG: ISKra4 family transposase, partial [Chloroflexi bacterium]|nr:ISKra4 family transposase [Chloroflexota bacterium]